MDHDLKVKFREYCHLTRQSQSGVIERLIVEHLGKKEHRPAPAKNEAGYSSNGAPNV